MAISQSDIQTQYQNVLGRQPTPSEISDMQRFGSTGYVDLTAGDIGTILQKTPEYQNQQLNTQGQQYSQQLGQSDSRILGLAGNQITQNLAQQGRTMSSSAYVNAFAGAAQNLAMQRQNTLANFYGHGYQNIQQNTQQQGNDTYGFGMSSMQTGQNRQWALQDYARQANDYQNSLRQQRTRGIQGQLTNYGLNVGESLANYGLSAMGIGGPGLKTGGNMPGQNFGNSAGNSGNTQNGFGMSGLT